MIKVFPINSSREKQAFELALSLLQNKEPTAMQERWKPPSCKAGLFADGFLANAAQNR